MENGNKTNWRKWVLSPNTISEDAQIILDQIADFPEISEAVMKSNDKDTPRLFQFINMAHEMGATKYDEYDRLREEQYYEDDGRFDLSRLVEG